MTLVLDASVVLKWLLNDPERESETERATMLMQKVVDGEENVVQPVHWLLEVAAVLTRISPDSAEDDVLMLAAMELPTDDGIEIMNRACRLALASGQHVFDTLYHAVALETPDAVYVTADERYLRAVRGQSGVVSLKAWQP